MTKSWALNDRAQLHKDANSLLDQNLIAGEPVVAILRGAYDSAMIALLNPLGFLPPMPRNPYAPPPALVGAVLKQQLDPKDHQGFLGLEIYPSPVRGLVKTLQRLLSLQ